MKLPFSPTKKRSALFERTEHFGFPPGLLVAAATLLLLFGAGPNFNLVLLAIAVLVFGGVLLWRQGETSVLFFAFFFGWLGSSIISFYGNWLDRDVVSFAQFGGDTRKAVTLSLVGLFFLTLGMRIGRGQQQSAHREPLQFEAQSIPIAKWFSVWLAAFLFVFATGLVGTFLPNDLRQLIVGFSNLRWAFFFTLVYAAFVQRSYTLLWLAFSIELLSSVGGFFADFKAVFLVATLAIFMSVKRLSAPVVIILVVNAIVLIGLGVVWTSIKGEYRNYLNAGSGQQIVVISYADRMDKLASLVAQLDGRDLVNGFDQMFRRISYVEYFGYVLTFVPDVEPHAKGDILFDALSRPFTPRLLFPNKAIIDDTARTNQYTGGLGGDSEGTSVSLGYVAEAYIDFGVPGMFGWLFAIGIIYGVVVRLMLSSFPPLLGNGLATSVLFSVGSLDNSFTKVFGGLVATLIVAWILGRYLIPVWMPQFKKKAA